MLRIGIVAGEPSGDVLASGLIREIKAIAPDCQFEGIAGPLMIKEGCKALWPLERLSVFGLFEVLQHLPELLSIRKQLLNHFLQNPPDVFIGIDAPDFNLALERKLFKASIPTVHYVSPTVWAWRPKRIKKLIGSLNALLCIFPFEEDYFRSTPVPAYYIGHPLADEIEADPDTGAARKRLGINEDTPVVAILPGSRMGELTRHSEPFLRAAMMLKESIPEIQFVSTFATEKTTAWFSQTLAALEGAPKVGIYDLPVADLLDASDCALAASGTVTLEVMLKRKPMVVAYRFAPATHWVLKTFSLFKAPFFSMPNLIAGKRIVPEILQDEVTAERLSSELEGWLTDESRGKELEQEYDKLIPLLKKNASREAAKVVLDVARKSGKL